MNFFKKVWESFKKGKLATIVTDYEKIKESLASRPDTSSPRKSTLDSFAEMVGQMLVWLRSDNGIVTLLLAAAVAVLYFAFGNDASEVMTASGVIIAGTAGGRHISDGPLTTSLTEYASPNLLRNEIDDRVVKIRPMSTPLDQISRWAGARACGSMIVDYYSVDTKPTCAAISEDVAAQNVANTHTVPLETDNNEMFDASETILVPDVPARAKNGTSAGALVLYVVTGGNSTEGITVIPVNNYSPEGRVAMPALPAGTKLIRMGRAAAELDVQTPQFEALPTKSQNFCQIFKAQVEESTFQKIANKEVGWTFSDQEEVAIIDMRLGLERSFLFGHRTRVYDPQKRSEVFLTGGIWNQTPRTFEYTLGQLDHPALVKMARAAFTQNAGSSRKLLIGGSGLIEALHNLNITRTIDAARKVTCWGIDFTEIVTKFGTLYVLPSEIFDECGHENDGFIIDPEYLTKYCHVPFRTEKLDLRGAGVRNTNAIVITEASCLVLRYPGAHMRVVATEPQSSND